ncbi:MAG: hypothetical protein HRU26_05585 [Psychroserpens sp.]|nr:hypothetical protein [Psychroserpens sp.]
MARLSEYDFELCKEICEEIANGGYIMDVLKQNKNYPSWSTFRRWKNEHEELQTLYVKAQQDKTEPIISHIKKVQLMALNGEIEPSVANVVIQTDKWLSSKFYPKMFGDKVDLTTKGDKIATPVFTSNPLDEE